MLAVSGHLERMTDEQLDICGAGRFGHGVVFGPDHQWLYVQPLLLGRARVSLGDAGGPTHGL